MTHPLIVEFEGAKFEAVSNPPHQATCAGCCFSIKSGDGFDCAMETSSGASLCHVERNALGLAGIEYRDAIFKPHDDAARALLVARTLTK